DQVYRIEQWGQTMMVVKRKDGSMYFDEEAQKKAFTDGLTKCCSYLGLGGDVHMGLFDDNKYVAELKQEKRKENDRAEDVKRKARKAKAPKEPPADETREEKNRRIAERERERLADGKQPSEAMNNGEDLDQEAEPFDRDV